MNKQVNQMVPGDIAQGFFLIKAVDCKTSNNTRRYLDMILSDQTGEINAKLWDCSYDDEAKYSIHVLVKIKGTVSEWQNRLQLKIEKIRLAEPEDGLQVGDFVPVAPQSADFMYSEIVRYTEKIENQDLHKIVSCFITDKKEKLLIYPAAKQNHHAVRSGLLYHIMTMLVMGENMCIVYPSLNRDLLFAGIILHDIAKIDEMDAGELGIVSSYTVEGELLGHIIQGIKQIDRVAREVGADEEISLLLQHMILSHHYEPEFGSPKRPLIPEAEMLHYLDIIDSRMYDMKKALDPTEAGRFSGKIWVLHNRRLYKSAFPNGEV
ncbi:MAG TPA: HD domain-containing protein [Negativicutes bacterium]